MQSKEYEIKYYDTDCKNRLKEPVLLNFLQDIASDNAEKAGFGYSAIHDKNIGWFLIKYHIKFYDELTNEGKIIIETESKGAMKINFIRDFNVYAPDGRKLAEASSSWVLADLTTRTLVLPESVFKNFPKADREKVFSTFPKIREPETYDYIKTFETTFSETDINGHINNAVYPTKAFDTLPYEVLIGTRIEELEIQYKKEMRCGEKIISKTAVSADSGTYIHNLTTESGDSVCMIRTKRIAYK